MRVSEEFVKERILDVEPVPGDPTLLCPDMEYVCETEEILDLQWRLVGIPILSIFTEDELVRKTLPGETDNEAQERFESVRRWMEDQGAESALSQSPVLLFLDDGDLTLIDGWHRCVVAHADFGMSEITAMIGSKAEHEPDTMPEP